MGQCDIYFPCAGGVLTSDNICISSGPEGQRFKTLKHWVLIQSKEALSQAHTAAPSWRAPQSQEAGGATYKARWLSVSSPLREVWARKCGGDV